MINLVPRPYSYEEKDHEPWPGMKLAKVIIISCTYRKKVEFFIIRKAKYS